MEIVDAYGLPPSTEDDGLPPSTDGDEPPSRTEDDEPAARTEDEPDALATLRVEIDALDQRLVQTLTERLRIVQAISEIKGRHGLLSLDPAREADIVKRATRTAREAGVPEEGVRDVIWAVLGYCRDGLVAAGTPHAGQCTATGGS